MFAQLRPAVVLMLLMTALLGLAYPYAVTGIAQVAMPAQANGSLVTRGDEATPWHTLRQSQCHEDQVDQLDADERHDQAAQPVD